MKEYHSINSHPAITRAVYWNSWFLVTCLLGYQLGKILNGPLGGPIYVIVQFPF